MAGTQSAWSACGFLVHEHDAAPLLQLESPNRALADMLHAHGLASRGG